jgi:NitT/TauT family transport system substrate-binding protein
MKRMLWAMVLTVACCCVVGNTWAASLTSIKVGYTNTASFMGLFIAKNEGIFARYGLDVEPVMVALNPTIPSALVGGSIQIGGVTPSVMLQAVDAGIDIVVVGGAAVNDIHNATGGVLARNGVRIVTAKDFEGKRVGVPGIGAYMHTLFRRWLVEQGANDKKVNFVEVPLAQGSDILRAGNVDAVLLSEPFYSRVISAKSGYLVARYLTQMPDNLFSMYYSSERSWALKNAAVLKAFRAALEEAKSFLNKDPVKSRAILSQTMKLPADVANTMVLPKLLVTVPPSDVRYWADTLLAQGMIRKNPDVNKLVIN